MSWREIEKHYTYCGKVEIFVIINSVWRMQAVGFWLDTFGFNQILSMGLEKVCHLCESRYPYLFEGTKKNCLACLSGILGSMMRK